jgi:transposase
VVGIDVSAARLDCYRLDEDRHWQVANDATGWAALLAALRGAPPRLIVLEATGKREQGVVRALAAAGMPPLVANPLAVRRFRQSWGTRAKTDRQDAKLLALYGERTRLEPTPVASDALVELQELVARRTQLKKLQTQETNRGKTVGATVTASHDRLAAAVAAELVRVDAQLAARVAAMPVWQARAERLMSVPGIGLITATRVIAGLSELGQVSRRTIAALVGVAPYANESGTTQGRRQIRGGRHPLRHGLFYATCTVVIREPTMRAHYQQLRARGKTHKQAIIACLRRLLGVLTVMERDELTWDQTRVGQGGYLPAAT